METGNSREDATNKVSSIEITQESCPNVRISFQGIVGVKRESEDHVGGSPSLSRKHMANELIKFNSQIKTMSQTNEILDFIGKVCFFSTSIYLVYDQK